MREDPEPNKRKRRFRVLIASAYFEPGFRAGGPVRSVAQLLDTAPRGADVLLATQDRDLGVQEPYEGLSGQRITRGAAEVLYLAKFSPRQWMLLLWDLRRNPPDLLYVNSLWNPTFTILPIVASRLRVFRVGGVLVAPRGELSPGALTLKARKKSLFLRAWRPFLSRAEIAWHASTQLEKADILRTFPNACVTVSSDQSGRPMEPLYPAAPSKTGLNMVFLGRISPKKNILLAVEALHYGRGTMSLDIFGPIEDKAYWARCESSIATLPPNVKVAYRGEIQPSEVCATFSQYDAFVFPTLGENFGHVIAESLGGSCPVICSSYTPWNSVLHSGGGEVLDVLEIDNLAEVLNRWAAYGADERTAARVTAGDAYRLWRSRQTVRPHLFSAFMDPDANEVGNFGDE